MNFKPIFTVSVIAILFGAGATTVTVCICSNRRLSMASPQEQQFKISLAAGDVTTISTGNTSPSGRSVTK